MMASTRLGNGMGTIVSAKDISGPQRLAELDYLDKLFYDIAAQTRVPLSLATAWLQRLKKRFEIEREDHNGPSLLEIEVFTLTLRAL